MHIRSPKWVLVIASIHLEVHAFFSYKNTWLRFQPACFLLLKCFFTIYNPLTFSKTCLKYFFQTRASRWWTFVHISNSFGDSDPNSDPNFRLVFLIKVVRISTVFYVSRRPMMTSEAPVRADLLKQSTPKFASTPKRRNVIFKANCHKPLNWKKINFTISFEFLITAQEPARE